jgi:hypothetical protein
MIKLEQKKPQVDPKELEKRMQVQPLVDPKSQVVQQPFDQYDKER